jgi:hypothetical protein|tara:strand:- start:1795 stop:2328 length:534 start_codon:yes stop_codon:yes gene_type:complete
MSIRFDLPDETKIEAEKIIEKNYRDMLLNTKMHGANIVKDWADKLTPEYLSSSNISISNETNMVSFEGLGVTQQITQIIQKVFPKQVVRATGFFHYPPTGYMGWHTNRNEPCKRLYLTWTNEAKKSFFRYIKDEKVITDYDDKGLTSRIFEVTGEEPFFWHCVGSETDRLSFGFSIR